MIGSGEKKYIEKCWKIAEQLNIREKIVYQEKMEQKYLSLLYKMADFFVLPTEYEIFGMVLLEAMYYKTVVLTTNNGGSDMMIENNINGIILDKTDVSQWGDNILDLINDTQRRKKMSQNACEH